MREIKHLSVHQWLRSAIPNSQQPISPIGFLFLKLPPPPCAVLLVIIFLSNHHVYHRISHQITIITRCIALVSSGDRCLLDEMSTDLSDFGAQDLANVAWVPGLDRNAGDRPAVSGFCSFVSVSETMTKKWSGWGSEVK